MKPGMYEGLDNEKYHGSAGVSKSGLCLVGKCPSKYKHRYIDGNQPERTPAMALGAALHTMVLEPQIFNDNYAVAPVINRRTKVGKAEWAAFQEANKNKDVLTQDDFGEISRYTVSIMSNPVARNILKEGVAEASLYHTDEETGKLVKCRPDWMVEGIIADVKTAIDASPEGFSKACFNLGYHIQAAMYKDIVQKVTGRTIESFIFIVVEKKEPYEAVIYVADDDMMHKGFEDYRATLQKYSDCVDNGNWTGYAGKKHYQKIGLPPWAFR